MDLLQLYPFTSVLFISACPPLLPLCCFIALLFLCAVSLRCLIREATLQPYLLPLVRTSPRTSLKEGKLYHRLKGPLRGPYAALSRPRVVVELLDWALTGLGRRRRYLVKYLQKSRRDGPGPPRRPARLPASFARSPPHRPGGSESRLRGLHHIWFLLSYPARQCGVSTYPGGLPTAAATSPGASTTHVVLHRLPADLQRPMAHVLCCYRTTTMGGHVEAGGFYACPGSWRELLGTKVREGGGILEYFIMQSGALAIALHAYAHAWYANSGPGDGPHALQK
jgi:hypothetical protein